jgi:putative acetyltransferase
MVEIRYERPEDIAGIRRVNETAFGETAEADLVDKLREAGVLTVSLVALQDGEIVGHIAFSPAKIESNETSVEAIGLGPMAVVPEEQNKGIGSELVSAGLDECVKKGCKIAVVLGHPNYYPRFGFAVAKLFDIGCEYNIPSEAFMVKELQEGALTGVSGTAKYRPEFMGE